MFGVSVTRLNQLARAGKLPAVQHNGSRFYRRHQLEVIANARDARWHGGKFG